VSPRVLCLTDRSDLPETELFIRLRSAGVDLEVACNPTGRYFDRLERAGVPVHELVAKSRFSPKAIRAIRRILKSRPFDILFCFNNKAASNTLLAARRTNHRIITYRGTVGNISFLSPASRTTHLHPRVACIVCVSRAVQKHILSLRLLGRRIPPERTAAIYKGHDPDWYKAEPADLSALFGIPRDAFVVGFAGRSRPHKGISHLIESLRYLPPGARIHLLLLGRLEGDKSVRERIAQCPYPDRIHAPGFREDAPSIFAACSAFVMPSTRREGLSRAVIEAMAQATPPIVTNVGGLPELVIDGESGCVVPPEDAEAIADAVLRLCRDPAAARQMGEKARQRIETEFHIDHTVRRMQALFDAVMK
jgi:glycosyltransferase involved in cell wall biosynthesis